MGDTTTDAFVERAEALIEERRQLRGALEAQIRGVQRRLDDIIQDQTRLEGALRTYRELMTTAEATPESSLFGEADGNAEADVRMGTVAEMAAAIMRRRGGRAKVGDV